MCIRHKLAKRAFTFLACLILLSAPVLSVSAEPSVTSDSVQETPVIALPEVPSLLSDAAIVINAKTGAVLYEKNSHGIYHPASCTKIMTALLTLENGVLSDTVTMSHNAIWGIDRDSSHIALDVDEEISVNDLLHGLLIASGNECAMGLAEYTSAKCGGNGTVEDFVDRMNRRAVELGAQNTHFVNPHGLYDDAHVTTPYDLAQIMRYCIQNQTFVSISGTTHYTVYTNYAPSGRPFSHSNKLLTRGSYHNEDVICGKTGYTKDSGGSLVSYASRDGMELITVTMGTTALKNSFEDTTALLNFCFENYSQVVPTAANKALASLTLSSGVDATVYSDVPENVILPKGLSFADLTPQSTVYASLSLPLAAGTPVGTVRWYYLDKEFASATLYTSTEVLPPVPEEETKDTPLFFRILLIAALVLIGIIVLFFIAAFINRSIRRAKRRRRKRVHQKGNIFR